LAASVTEQRDFLQIIVDTARDPMLVLGKNLRVVSANRSFYQTFGISPKATEDALVYELGNGQWNIPALRRLLEDIVPQSSTFDDFEVEHDFPGIGRKVMLLNARKWYRPGNHTEMLLLAIEDVTERRDMETKLRESAEELQQAYDNLSIVYEREHKIAEALQRPLTLEIAEEAFPGLSVATLYEAASSEAEIGGDFFDAFPLPKDRVALSVADASGKGLAAAARAMQAKDVLRAFARECPHAPAAIASRLSDYIHDAKHFDQLPGSLDTFETFVCLALAVIHTETGETSVLAAGAEPPLLLRKNGDYELVEVSGMPLGVSSQQMYTTMTVRLGAGDTLILLTDGITEARAPKKASSLGSEFLGEEGLVRLAREAQSETATVREMGRFILNGARAFGSGVLRDDACILLVRRR
jgi:serine phosphatase RsbU (regulator of sigma subunit)